MVEYHLLVKALYEEPRTQLHHCRKMFASRKEKWLESVTAEILRVDHTLRMTDEALITRTYHFTYFSAPGELMRDGYSNVCYCYAITSGE